MNNSKAFEVTKKLKLLQFVLVITLIFVDIIPELIFDKVMATVFIAIDICCLLITKHCFYSTFTSFKNAIKVPPLGISLRHKPVKFCLILVVLVLLQLFVIFYM